MVGKSTLELTSRQEHKINMLDINLKIKKIFQISFGDRKQVKKPNSSYMLHFPPTIYIK